jgi:hypothetical protein
MPDLTKDNISFTLITNYKTKLYQKANHAL